MDPESTNTTLEELLLDQSFCEYVKATNDASVAFWGKWILEHPERSEEISKATLVMKTLLSARKIPVTTTKEESLQLLIKQIDKLQNNNGGGLVLRLNSVWLRIAAITIITLSVAATWLWINKNTGIKYNVLAYNEIVVPLGEKAKIQLSDGTSVWINSDSKIKFPEKFGDGSREVFLEGEAFFDVTKKGHDAFVVHTRLSDIKVLGTAFNVKCYTKDGKVQTTVVRGLVQVQETMGKKAKIVIKPNEMVTIKENSTENLHIESLQPVVLTKTESKNITNWKDQLLSFSGETFDEIKVKMERWFNVVIVLQDENLKTERFRGTFSHNENVYQVLEAIKVTMPITYKTNNDTIFVKEKK